MSAKPLAVRSLPPCAAVFAAAALAWGQAAPATVTAPLPEQAQAYVGVALANELQAVENPNHPMRYQLRKSSPRLTTTKEIVETKDGEVALLLAVNDKPLSSTDAQKEQARLDGLLSDSGKQRHRKQSEEADAGRLIKVLRALPSAFIYQYSGAGQDATGKQEKFTFKPNPDFTPPDLETQVLTAMNGAIWIDPASDRVTRLEGHLLRDVDFGWGILGRLNRGGWIVIEDANVCGDQWRIVHFQMQLSGRVLFRTRNFDTVEDESHFEPLPVGMGYRQAIQMLRTDP